MEPRRLGSFGPLLPPLGLGCWAMTGAYGKADNDESIATIRRALDLGFPILDTADAYGDGHNEIIVGRAIQGRRDAAFVCTKFGAKLHTPKYFSEFDGRPEYVHAACDASLERLGTDRIDLFYCHRLDGRTPLEETVGAMAELVAAGKVRFIGLSEASADELRRAHAVHPIAALQSEYSLFSRDHEATTIPLALELGIAFVPYAPLGRGQLTGRLKRPEDMDPTDWRHAFPRFQGVNFARNLTLVGAVETAAKAKGCTPAQFALAWLLARGPHIFPIPGAEKRAFLEQNVGACDVTLSATDMDALERAVPQDAIAGSRGAQPGDRRPVFGES